jgi:hypothetical protein
MRFVVPGRDPGIAHYEDLCGDLRITLITSGDDEVSRRYVTRIAGWYKNDLSLTPYRWL